MCEMDVICIVDRSWDPFGRMYVGEQKHGVLLHFLTADYDGMATPAGVVCFDDDTFEAVPLEFITKI